MSSIQKSQPEPLPEKPPESPLGTSTVKKSPKPVPPMALDESTLDGTLDEQIQAAERQAEKDVQVFKGLLQQHYAAKFLTGLEGMQDPSFFRPAALTKLLEAQPVGLGAVAMAALSSSN